ncbi:hypothetical protein EDD22DRAFT_492406 [Suillus occidentalis]|nr:hypothetical protein EDD22DRAFT_492406 [Suillus occidentalis]
MQYSSRCTKYKWLITGGPTVANARRPSRCSTLWWLAFAACGPCTSRDVIIRHGRQWISNCVSHWRSTRVTIALCQWSPTTTPIMSQIPAQTSKVPVTGSSIGYVFPVDTTTRTLDASRVLMLTVFSCLHGLDTSFRGFLSLHVKLIMSHYILCSYLS